MLVSDALSDQTVEAYTSTGLVMALYVASMVSLCLPHFVEVRTFEYVDCFASFGCGQVYVSVVSKFGVKCEYFLCVVMGSVVYLKSELCAIFCMVRDE